MRPHQVVGVGSGQTHGEVRFRQFKIGFGDAIDQALHGFLVGVPAQHAIEVHQVAGQAGLVLFEQLGELRRQVVNPVGQQEQRRFGLPGLGAYVIEAIGKQDFAIVRTMVFLGSLLYIATYILIDIAYSWADPRVRLT